MRSGTEWKKMAKEVDYFSISPIDKRADISYNGNSCLCSIKQK
jgi:hypothetical protein